MTETQLITIPNKSINTVFQPNGLEPFIEEIKQKIKELEPDVTTNKGRKAIASFARRIATSKIYVDEYGKELNAEKKRLIKITDTERKRWRDTMDALKAQVYQPLAEWKEKEEQRKSDIQSKITDIESYNKEYLTFKEATQTLYKLSDITIDQSYEEFYDEAEEVLSSTLSKLREQKNLLKQQETLAEEAIKLKKEKEEWAVKQRKEQAVEEARLKKEKEEAARQEREKKIVEETKLQAERKAADALEKEKELRIREQLKAEQAIKEKEEAVKKEQERVAAANAEKIRDAELREADHQYRKRINNEALKCLTDEGISKDIATQCITLIAQKKVKHIVINY